MQGETVRMSGSVKGPVSVIEAADDEDEGKDLDSALDVLGMIPITWGHV